MENATSKILLFWREYIFRMMILVQPQINKNSGRHTNKVPSPKVDRVDERILR
jgi:hypothetical protein